MRYQKITTLQLAQFTYVPMFLQQRPSQIDISSEPCRFFFKNNLNNSPSDFRFKDPWTPMKMSY